MPLKAHKTLRGGITWCPLFKISRAVPGYTRGMETFIDADAGPLIVGHSILVLVQASRGEFADDGFVLLSPQGTCQRDRNLLST